MPARDSRSVGGNLSKYSGIRLRKEVCRSGFLFDGREPIASVIAVRLGLGATGMLLHILYWIAFVLAAAPLVYYALSLYCVLGYFRALGGLRSLRKFCQLLPAGLSGIRTHFCSGGFRRPRRARNREIAN